MNSGQYRSTIPFFVRGAGQYSVREWELKTPDNIRIGLAPDEGIIEFGKKTNCIGGVYVPKGCSRCRDIIVTKRRNNSGNDDITNIVEFRIPIGGSKEEYIARYFTPSFKKKWTFVPAVTSDRVQKILGVTEKIEKVHKYGVIVSNNLIESVSEYSVEKIWGDAF